MAGREILQLTDKTHLDNQVEDNSAWSRLAADAWSVAGGMAKGVKDSAVDLIERPGASAIKIGMVAAGAVILGGMQARAGLFRMGAEALTAGMGMAYLNDMHTSFRSLANTFDPLAAGQVREQNLANMGNRAGQFLFNTALFTGVGLASAKFGQKYFDFSQANPVSFSANDIPMSSYDRMIMSKMR